MRVRMLLQVHLPDADSTRRLGEGLAAQLVGPACVALIGPLGAGKTTLAQGFARALGISAPVASPTFVLAIDHDDGRWPLTHLDAYRLEGDIGWEDLLEIGWDRMTDGQRMLLIEWADRIRPYLPEDRLEVHLAHAPQGRQARITVVGSPPLASTNGESLRAALQP